MSVSGRGRAAPLLLRPQQVKREERVVCTASEIVIRFFEAGFSHTQPTGERFGMARGNYLAEDRLRADGVPKKRVHRLNLRIDPDLYRALRRKARNSGLNLSAAARLALEGGLSRPSSRDDLR